MSDDNLPFHTWKLVTDGDDYTLTDDELYELDVIENLYRKVGDVIHEDGMIWDFESGRQARLSIHEKVPA